MPQRSPNLSNVIDAAHLAHQREWSDSTFGPGARTAGVIDHIRKELVEVEADPSDLSEWADVLILAFDGATRAGHSGQAVIDAIKAKQARNEQRVWPDWRTADPDKAIEHVRTPEPESPMLTVSVHNEWCKDHEPRCRRHLISLFPTYGNDCTCRVSGGRAR